MSTWNLYNYLLSSWLVFNFLVWLLLLLPRLTLRFHWWHVLDRRLVICVVERALWSHFSYVMRYIFIVPQILSNSYAFFGDLGAVWPQATLELGKQKHALNLTFEWPESWVDVHDECLRSISWLVHIEDFLRDLVDQNAKPVIQSSVLQKLGQLSDHHLLELRVLRLIYSCVEVVSGPRLLDFETEVSHSPIFLMGLQVSLIVLLLIHYYYFIDIMGFNLYFLIK